MGPVARVPSSARGPAKGVRLASNLYPKNDLGLLQGVQGRSPCILYEAAVFSLVLCALLHAKVGE